MENTISHRPAHGILLKVISVCLFLVMQTAIKMAGSGLNPGQITFYRSAFALIPVCLWLYSRGELASSFRTESYFGHFRRGAIGIASMAGGFYGLTVLPLPEWIAIGYAQPLFSVVFAALLLGETVRIYRWTAAGIGFLGVLIISWPKLTLFHDQGTGSTEALGAMVVLVSAALAAMAMIQVRLLVKSEKTPTIVLYFSIIATLLSLLSLPFGWQSLSLSGLAWLAAAGMCGGVAQIFLTESYRFADVSTIAPFDYTSILFGTAVGYYIFGDIPSHTTAIGSVFVIGAGIFIIYRERARGLERSKEKAGDVPV